LGFLGGFLALFPQMLSQPQDSLALFTPQVSRRDVEAVSSFFLGQMLNIPEIEDGVDPPHPSVGRDIGGWFEFFDGLAQSRLNDLGPLFWDMTKQLEKGNRRMIIGII
jgi:hypothetical protein